MSYNDAHAFAITANSFFPYQKQLALGYLDDFCGIWVICDKDDDVNFHIQLVTCRPDSDSRHTFPIT